MHAEINRTEEGINAFKRKFDDMAQEFDSKLKNEQKRIEKQMGLAKDASVHILILEENIQ
jgi:hypothetical protein